MNFPAVVEQPLVSIIVPAWNSERWISETLLSALGQTWAKIEVLVVDDGSTDRTVGIVKSLPDNRVRCVQQQHGGAASARNRGLREARGDLIQFLDADDLISADKVALQIAALHDSPPGSVASCSWLRFGDDTFSVRVHDEPVWPVEDPVEWLTESLSGGGMMQPAGWLIPRSIADASGPWDESLTLHDDGEYFARVLVRASRNVFVRDARVFYRDVSGSLSRRRSRAAIQSAFDVCSARSKLLLSARDDSRTRRAAATQFAQFAYEFRRTAPDLSKRALGAIESLGVTPRNVVGGSSFRVMSKLFGLSTALSIRSTVARGR